MADNIAVTAGAGTNVATDDVGGAHYQRVKPQAGADGVAVDACLTKATSSFDRPADATPYTADDAIADNTTAGSVTPLSFTIAAGAGTIRRVKVQKDTPASTVSHVRVWFFEGSVTVGAGDNAAFTAPMDTCIGYADVAVTIAGSDAAVGWANVDIPFVNGTLKALLQDKVGDTPTASDTWEVEIYYLPG